MKVLNSPDHFNQAFLLLRETEAGRRIEEGSSRIYPAALFLPDLEAVRELLGLDYISFLRLRSYTEFYPHSPLGNAIGATCGNLIRMGNLGTPKGKLDQ